MNITLRLLTAQRGFNRRTKLATKSTAPRAPRLIFSACEDIPAYREEHGLTQIEFWSRIGVSQSCGSRYERGRHIPKPIRRLLHIASAPAKQSSTLVRWLRRDST